MNIKAEEFGNFNEKSEINFRLICDVIYFRLKMVVQSKHVEDNLNKSKSKVIPVTGRGGL
jgi:hypothetical protein